MTTSVRSSLPLLLVAACLGMMAPAADAQWKWRDAQGKLVFSDVPPPPSISDSRIVSAPGSRAGGPLKPVSEAPPAAAPASAAAPARTPPAAPPPTPEEAFQKRHAERLKAEATERTKANEQQLREARCTQLRSHIKMIGDGGRLGRARPDGSMEYLDDDARQKELSQTRETLARECV